jgi:hypothetical protein
MKQQVSTTAVVLWQESGELLGHVLEAAVATETNAARAEMALYECILKGCSKEAAAVCAVLGFPSRFISFCLPTLLPLMADCLSQTVILVSPI